MLRPIRLMILSAILCLLGLGYSLSFAQTRVVGQTPQSDPAYAQGVSGHGATLLSQGKKRVLLMLGGCNFPDQPASEGGKKRFYSEVYTAAFKSPKRIKKWQLAGRLPQAVAYAGYARYAERFIVAGGQSEAGDLASVYRLGLTKEGTLLVDSLPQLPQSRRGMATSLVGSRLYLIGGVVGGRLSNSVISLDLEQPEAGWREEAPYPGDAKLKVLATTLKGKIYAYGSFAKTESDTEPAEVQMCEMVYDPEQGTWEQNDYEDYDIQFEGYTFGGGHIYASEDSEMITLIGGVRAERFLPALQREQKLRQAIKDGDTALVQQYRQEAKTYLTQEVSWYQFCPTLCFVIKNPDQPLPIAMSLEPSRHLAKADGALVEVAPNAWILLGGETKPGVRTSDIVY